ncbi:sodium channel protein type 4 subunit alpha B, partial [Biomphalaria glabrata]
MQKSASQSLMMTTLTLTTPAIRRKPSNRTPNWRQEESCHHHWRTTRRSTSENLWRTWMNSITIR